MSASGFTPISLYYSTTASAVPTAANLVPGELAINTADGKLYYEDSSGVVQVLATKSTGSIGGSNTQVQFNNSGSLGGSSGLTWDGSALTTSRLALGGTTLPSAGTAILFSRTSDNNTYLQTGSGNNFILLDGSQNTMATFSPTALSFNISNTNKLTLNSTTLYTASGVNVGIGTSSPATKLVVYDTTAPQVTFDNGTSTFIVGNNVSGNNHILYGTGAYPMIFYTNATQAMTLDASGNLLVGDTSVIGSGKLSIKSDNSVAMKGVTSTSGGNIVMYRADTSARIWEITANSSNFFIANGDFTSYAYLAATPTVWLFASDRRIKTDIVDIEYGLNAVMAMKPRKYKMLASGETNIGFVAQELKTVVPEAVAGEEIEYLDTDTPQEKAAKTMGVSKDTLIPVLVKAIQELKAEFDAYKATHP